MTRTFSSDTDIRMSVPIIDWPTMTHRSRLVDQIDGLLHNISHLLFVLVSDQVLELGVVECVAHLIRDILGSLLA